MYQGEDFRKEHLIRIDLELKIILDGNTIMKQLCTLQNFR